MCFVLLWYVLYYVLCSVFHHFTQTIAVPYFHSESVILLDYFSGIMDLETKQFFRNQIASDPANKRCVDCDGVHPQWASVSFGTYFCLRCSGTHRSLGVHISFVRSVTMDSWSEKQKKMMIAGGGNGKFLEFCKQHEIDGMDIKQKYNTKAAEFYRDRVKAICEGTALPSDISPGQSLLNYKFLIV